MTKLKRLCVAPIALLAACATHVPNAGGPNVAFSADDPHWAKINDKDCWIYASWPNAGKSADWNGACSRGLAEGQGVAVWHEAIGSELEVSGRTQNGVFEGPITLDQSSPVMHVHEQVNVVAGVANGFGTYEADMQGVPILQYTGNFSNALFNGRGRAYSYSADGVKTQDGIWVNGEFSSGQSSVVPRQDSPQPIAPTAPQYATPSHPGEPDANGIGKAETSPAQPLGAIWASLSREQKKAMSEFIRAAADTFFSCKLNHGKTSDCLDKGFESGSFAAVRDIFCSSPIFMTRLQQYANTLQANLISDRLRDATYSIVCPSSATN